MDLSDLRRLSFSTMVLAGVLIVWLIFLALHDGEQFQWAWPEAALGWFGLAAWMWTAAGLLVVMVGVLGLSTYGVSQAPPGFARGKLRQVQCQDCKAVFFVHDAGNRPLTHMCPNCKALGVYDGTAPPVGEPPKPLPPEKVVALKLTCHQCDNRFQVTDTGVRPLKVACNECGSTGTIN